MTFQKIISAEKKYYHCVSKTLSGTSYREVYAKALVIFQKEKAKTRRIPYLRSSYFQKEKIFISLLFEHICKKNMRDRTRRLKLIECAFECVKNTSHTPDIVQNPNRKSETFYRFYGVSGDGKKFTVQIKEVKTQGKYCISFFPH